MIKINCETKDTISIIKCKAFQGNLKERKKKDIDELKKSLINDGLMMPFAIWKHDDCDYIIDGHGRREALIQLSTDIPEILTFQFPCVYIEAENEDDAKKALLQITSQYGKITKNGYKEFSASIPTYVAPSIKKFVAKPESMKVSIPETAKVKKENKRVVKISVDEKFYDEVIKTLESISYIDIVR